MGITPTALRLLARERAHRPEGKSVLTLGNLDVWSTESEILDSLRAEGLTPHPFQRRRSQSALLNRLASGDAVHARTLFEMLGFEDYVDIDKFDHDRPGILHDLNLPLPAELRDRFDFVLDFGTTEHIFNVPAVLESIVRALRVGGVILHSQQLPALYWSQHGYYVLTPDLLIDFYEANGFTDVRCLIFYYTKPWLRGFDQRIYQKRARMFRYDRSVNLQYVVPRNALPLFWVSARKGRNMDAIRIPDQPVSTIAAGSSDGNHRLRAAAKSLFHAFEPLTGSIVRRAYRASHGLTLSTI